MRIPYVALLCVALGAAACGPSTRQIRPSSPFTAGMARLFDDSVDYVQDVEGLGGRVASDWEQQIDGLARGSDLMGVATIETVLQGQDENGTQIYRLTANLTDILHGDAPSDRHVQLRVSEGQAGFNTVAGKEERLQRGRYVLFVKWYTDGNGEVQAHWHLSPYSDSLMARVRHTSGLEEQQLGAERVVRTDRGNQ
jgi:hypothetical protein